MLLALDKKRDSHAWRLLMTDFSFGEQGKRHRTTTLASRIEARKQLNGKRLDLRQHDDEPCASVRVPFLDARPDQCRWPYGSGVETEFCGHKTVKNSSWCAHHYRRAFPPCYQPRNRGKPNGGSQ